MTFALDEFTQDGGLREIAAMELRINNNDERVTQLIANVVRKNSGELTACDDMAIAKQVAIALITAAAKQYVNTPAFAAQPSVPNHGIDFDAATQFIDTVMRSVNGDELKRFAAEEYNTAISLARHALRVLLNN